MSTDYALQRSISDIQSKISTIDHQLLVMRAGTPGGPPPGRVFFAQALAAVYRLRGEHERADSVERAAVNPAQTTVAGWASELTTSPVGGLLLAITKQSAYAAVAGRTPIFSLDTQIAKVVVGGDITAGFIAEGQPANVAAGALSPLTLTPKKLVALTTFSEELLQYAVNLPAILRQLLSNGIATALDSSLPLKSVSCFGRREIHLMRVCIHRGTKQIGGNCVEIEASGRRIIVDLGLPLDAVESDPALVPQISGLREHDPSLLAIVVSHGHRDHWGLIPKVRPDIPIVMGQAAERIMGAAADFVPDAFAPKAWKHLESGKPLQIGPFAITPHLVDHSGFDAYALEIEADGRRLFYSGDLRAHGRKSKLFERMLRQPPKNIDVMLMEGSTLGRLADNEGFPTEDALERIFIERFKSTAGMALVVCSPQNIDRVVTIYRAAKQTQRTLVVDAYAAEVLKATGYESIPKPMRGWPNIAVFILQRQRVHLKRKNIAPLVDSYRSFRLWPEQLAEHAPRTVMLSRPWMFSDLDRAKALTGAMVIWSQWEGYLKEGSGAQLEADCKARGIPFEVIHTSGHASVADLKRLAAAIGPKRLIPIHTFERERFPDLFENATLVNDGESVEV